MTTPATPALSVPAGAGLSVDTRRLASRENLVQAGQQFESIFIGMMLSSMRKVELAEPMFDSQALRQFRDMQDQQLAKTMAETAPIGIGRAMTEFLARSQPELAQSEQPQPEPARPGQETLATGPADKDASWPTF